MITHAGSQLRAARDRAALIDLIAVGHTARAGSAHLSRCQCVPTCPRLVHFRGRERQTSFRNLFFLTILLEETKLTSLDSRSVFLFLRSTKSTSDIRSGENYFFATSDSLLKTFDRIEKVA